jgi:hypothetical protein
MRKALIVMLLAAGCGGTGYRSDGQYQAYRSRGYQPVSTFDRNDDAPFDITRSSRHRDDPDPPDLFDTYTIFQP